MLDERHCGAHGSPIPHILQGVIAGSYHPLGQTIDLTHQLQEYRTRRVEGHGHCQLPDVVYSGWTLDLGDLSHIDLSVLSYHSARLQLQHRSRVVDVSGVQEGSKTAGECRREPPNQVGKADGVSPAPGNELPLHDPMELPKTGIGLLPVAIDTQYLMSILVNGQDVRGGFAGRKGVFLEGPIHLDLPDFSEPVFIVAVLLTTLNLVVGLLGS